MKTNRTKHFNLFILTTLAVALLGIRAFGPVIGRAQSNQDTTTQSAKPFDQALALENLRKAIAGQENKPAEEVFKNIQMLKGMPAGHPILLSQLSRRPWVHYSRRKRFAHWKRLLHCKTTDMVRAKSHKASVVS